MNKPTFSREYEEIIRKRHDLVLNKVSKINKSKIFKLGQIKLRLRPSVFPPLRDSIVLATIVSKIKNPGYVLDLGTGSGIQAICVAKNAKKVLATDINREALKCVRENSKLNKINNLEIRYSNIFSNIKEKFDTIILNPPFRYFKPKNVLDKSMTDFNYKSLTNFFKNAKKHLKKNGKIYVCFSNLGDLNYFRSLIKKNKFKYKILKKAKAESFGEKIKFYYYIYELRR